MVNPIVQKQGAPLLFSCIVMDRVVWGYEVAENSYKTEAIGEKLCGKKGRGGWILSRNVRGGSVKIFGGGGGGPLWQCLTREAGKRLSIPCSGCTWNVSR